MSIGGITSTAALQTFLGEKDLPSVNRANRLYIKNNQLLYGADLGCMTLFAAKLGFGSAAMSNVSKFIKDNKDTCLTDDKMITDYNAFITSYNDKQHICWKKAKKIKKIAIKAFDSGINFDYGSRDGMHQLIKHHLSNCADLLKNPNLDENLGVLIESCQNLKNSVDCWTLDSQITKEEKQTLNEILQFKNEARNTFFPAKDKPLKGPACEPKALRAPQEDKDIFRQELKELRRAVLTKYFHERLELDGAKLAQLRIRFNENKGNLPEEQFLSDQLDRWQKKLDQGKPIAIPKWYHCTKTPLVIDSIINTDILYKHDGMYPGVFLANLPEHGYGQHCLMISDHIEKTGTKESGSDLPIYPKFSKMSQPSAIRYSDTPVAPENSALNNNQDGLGIWFGFQRGKNSGGTAGIPIQKMKRVNDGGLKYYKDTTLGFIYSNKDPYSYHQNNNPKELEPIGQKYRVQVIQQKEAEAMRTLINATFFCTLPTSWEGNLQQSR